MAAERDMVGEQARIFSPIAAPPPAGQLRIRPRVRRVRPRDSSGAKITWPSLEAR